MQELNGKKVLVNSCNFVLGFMSVANPLSWKTANGNCFMRHHFQLVFLCFYENSIFYILFSINCYSDMMVYSEIALKLFF